MMEYDKKGVGPDGTVDQKRKFVSTVTGMLGADREFADKLYKAHTTNTNKNVKGEEDKPKMPKFKDVDYPLRSRKKASLVDIYKPKVQKKTMKQGGLVRGAGCAQRGRGRGKVI